MVKRVVVAAAALATVLLASPGAEPLAAQSVRGMLAEEGGGPAIEGAVVVLVDSAGRPARRTLTDPGGGFEIRAPGPGRYTLRADRVGYVTAASAPFAVAAGEVRQVTLEAPRRVIELTGLRVTGRSPCEVRPRDGRETATVWEEARKALAAAAISQEEGLLRYESSVYERELSPLDLRVVSETRRARTVLGDHPFVSLPGESFARLGFVRWDADARAYTYHAPDARALLSDAFLDTHCFRLVEHSDSADLIGLSFEPVPGRRQPEIEGTFWLDRRTSALRFLEYAYLNLPLSVPAERFGGRVEFQRVPRGGWIVRRWYIRMPDVVDRSVAWRGRSREERVLASVREAGGEVVRVQTLDGRILEMSAARAPRRGS